MATPIQPTTYPPIALIGPTASGKSTLALELAKTFPLEIISVDSVLIYQGMDIGTAKPSKAEQDTVVHHLIDILAPSQTYSAAQFVHDAQACISQIQGRGHLPLLVGGTMLYFMALRQGLDDLPSADWQIRQTVQQEAMRHGWQAMHARLQTVDPPSAQRLSPHDSQRIGRALEVYLQTGRPLSSFLHTGKTAAHRLPNLTLISLEPEDRQWLHQRIANRTQTILEQGLVQEVKNLWHGQSLNAQMPSMRCVGYRQVLDSLEERKPWEDLAQRITVATRQLAKRQLTWLRSMPRVVVACDDTAATVESKTLALMHGVLQDCRNG